MIDPSKIDVLIANHVEMDHSGSTPVIHEMAPGAQIYCSAPQGVKNMTAHFGDLGYNGVKTGRHPLHRQAHADLRADPDGPLAGQHGHLRRLRQDPLLNDAFGQHFARLLAL